MRGRKLHPPWNDGGNREIIKKESPNEGTETAFYKIETYEYVLIKKESPNEGTETKIVSVTIKTVITYKKRIPE